MSISVKNLDAPYVAGLGYLADPITGHVTGGFYPFVNQAIPGGTPESITNVAPYMFSNWVMIISQAIEVGVDMINYGLLSPVNGLHNAYAMLPETEHGAGNILYTFGPNRTLSPTESYFITQYGFLLLKPGAAYPTSVMSDMGIDIVLPTYVFADDVIEITLAVFAQGRVGDKATIKIKLV